MDRGVWCVESNRGCPYGCVFCDWGSATLSRIRTFDLGRVKAELHWLAERGVGAAFMGDANFGVFSRDLDIARFVARLAERFGAPRWFHVTYAKNSTRYTIDIADALRGAGLQHEVTISLQSADSGVLDAIDRSNLPAEKLLDLARRASERGLPALVDLILGLPGSTPATFRDDLDRCVEAGLHPRVFGGLLLPNSPMNEPSYRDRHLIESDEFTQVVSWRGCTRRDGAEVVAVWDLFVAAWQFGVLRHVVEVAAILGRRRPMDLLDALRSAALDRPDEVPHLAFFIGSVRRYLAAPCGWSAVLLDVVAVLSREVGPEFAHEIATAATLREAVLPEASRLSRTVVELDHDVVALLTDTRAGVGDARLASYPSFTFEATDPLGLCSGEVRQPRPPRFNAEGDRVLNGEWGWFDGEHFELASCLSQPTRGAFVS